MLAVIVFLATCFVAGGLLPSLIKLGVQDIPPLTLTWFRVTGGVIVLFPFILKNKERVPFKDLYKVVPFAINIALFSIGIQYTSLIMGNIIYTIDPILVAFLGYFFLKEKLTTHSIIGLIISLIGVSILIQGSIQTSDIFSFGTPLGNFFVSLASFSWAFWYITSRTLIRKYSSTTIIFYASLVTSIILIPLLPFEWSVKPLIVQNFTPQVIFIILGVILFGALVFQLLNQWLIKNTSAFFASLTSYGSIFFAGLSGMIFFGEKITIQLFIGGLFVIAGVFLATTYKHIRRKGFEEV